MELQTYGKSKPPCPQKIREDVLAILKRKINGELPFVRITDLRRRVCSKVKAPCFFELIKEMEKDELLMIDGPDMTWESCAVWDHPRIVQWRIERAAWLKEMKEIDKKHAEERRQWQIASAPRLARERFQKELGEFFVHNADQLFETVRKLFAAYTPKRSSWLYSRHWLLAMLFLLLFATGPALAWNNFGHEAIAYLAYKKLTPQTKARVDQLLKLNPYYSVWQRQTKSDTGDTDAQIFTLAATWPDAIKRDPGYQSDGSANGNTPDGPYAARNIGYSDFLRHKYWHYIDTPFSRDGTPLPPIPPVNALAQIEAFRKVLSSDAPDALKSYDLVWLMHIVGDVHQPLHCTTRVSRTAPQGDNGGNDVRIAGNDKVTELHAFWDDVLGPDGSDAIKFAESLKEPSARSANISDPNEWIAEGFALAKKDVYRSPIGPGNGPYKLNRSYERRARTLARERAALAGQRLANLLTNELR